MTAAALIDALRRQDVHLAIHGDRLEVDAPAGVLTDDVRRELRAHRPEILARIGLIPMLTGAATEVSREGLRVTADELLVRLSDSDMQDTQLLTPQGLEAFARASQASLMRRRRQTPPGWIAETECSSCAWVPIFEGCSANVDGCPWCFNRIQSNSLSTLANGSMRA